MATTPKLLPADKSIKELQEQTKSLQVAIRRLERLVQLATAKTNRVAHESRQQQMEIAKLKLLLKQRD